jgi:hypothetical protein
MRHSASQPLPAWRLRGPPLQAIDVPAMRHSASQPLPAWRLRDPPHRKIDVCLWHQGLSRAAVQVEKSGIPSITTVRPLAFESAECCVYKVVLSLPAIVVSTHIDGNHRQ